MTLKPTYVHAAPLPHAPLTQQTVAGFTAFEAEEEHRWGVGGDAIFMYNSMPPMANHSEAQYTAWIREITGIDSLDVRVEPGAPMEILVLILHDALGKAQEIFRLPTRFAYNQDLLAKHIPSHLHVSNRTLDMRIRLATAFRDPELLEECMTAFPETRWDMEEVEGKAQEVEALGARAGVVFDIYETRRKVQEWLLTLVDTDIMRLQRFVDARARNH